ncbi:polysaccharide deacetylase family protein [Pseudonocardia humida]|uniref:Polysaccharide deacetylase family protein n=1 Tax=Pseudonocardia humida TaxID=2800819 RepID=A0ABT0ZXX0_9PSEU|nr:polysaccharide deacetylase family protein [Pseudonocardia humida]MCO1655592.1 polysaccharide deacetylase family protein [Pseudonocardia humida]
MRGLTHFEIRACALALLAYGLVVPLVPAAAPEHPVAEVAGPGPVLALPDLVAPAVAVPQVLDEVVGAPPLVRTVALTFDDGPDPRWTPQVLDLLARHGAVATFCVLGENAERHPELLTEIVEAGMRLCDHSRTHDVDPAAPRDGLAHDELVDLSGAEVDWFRAPRGEWSESLQVAAGAEGMRPLGWSVDSRDWTRPGAGAIVAGVQRHLHPGAVVLMHDGGGDRGQTVEALEQLLPWLAAQCYTTGFPDGG